MRIDRSASNGRVYIAATTTNSPSAATAERVRERTRRRLYLSYLRLSNVMYGGGPGCAQ